ncbi:MAG: exodeoxyribonuclease VII large subunit [Verrucomicrobia bacterium 21-51-4]|nr:MAG: exodeoxyribonuclease VII large subunit [Verrucomicrobia bacterium 21-51-4]HQU08373.1 exodeoxyribonuclease VII large subunit [Opitutales bacterium]
MAAAQQTELLLSEPSSSGDYIHSVTQINERVRALIEPALGTVWVRGEISNLRRQASGHSYFTLKDTASQLSAVLFRGNSTAEHSFLVDGAQVIAFGALSVYTPRGSYQIVIRHLMPDGQGRLQLEFARLKAQLTAEGLFDPARKKQLPAHVKRIAIITSPTGAAIRDFISVLRRRQWWGTVHVLPAAVQGDAAVAEIRAQLDWAEHSNLFDLIVLARGGGSLEDLWAFNDEGLVRAIASCSISTLSAVGHEIDFTLSDFAADWRAETPTAAAERISSDSLQLRDRMQSATERLQRISLSVLEQNKLRLQHAHNLWVRLSPERMVQTYAQRLDDLWPRAQQHIGARIQQIKDRCESLTLRLNNARLERTLDRGFAAIKTPQGQYITSAREISSGTHIAIQFADGELPATVEESR